MLDIQPNNVHRDVVLVEVCVHLNFQGFFVLISEFDQPQQRPFHRCSSIGIDDMPERKVGAEGWSEISM